MLAACVEVDAQRGRRWVDGSRRSRDPDGRRRRRFELAQALAERRHRTVAADGARLERLLTNPEQRAGTLRGVDAVDSDVDVAVVGVAVKRIDGLVLAKAHLGEIHPDGLVRLDARRLLTLSPAQDPVLLELRAATGDLGEIDHLLYLTVVVDVEEVERFIRSRWTPCAYCFMLLADFRTGVVNAREKGRASQENDRLPSQA